MSTPAGKEWTETLTRLNSLVLRSDKWRDELPPECLSSGWCGSPSAPESEILAAEKRLGVKLPPSYRAFLSISNGWRPFSEAIERLLPVEEIERLETAEPENLVAIQKYYHESEISDEAYLDYDTPKHMEALRHRYYPRSLLVGKSWGVEGDIVLLNPQIVTHEGEWETIFFANWIPGNQRYRSFFEFVAEKARIEQGLRTGRP